MNLGKAIEVNERHLNHPYIQALPTLQEAIKLSIEALKWIKWRRKYYRQPPILLLPGETEE